MKARIVVTLKNGVLDPQGKAIEGALEALNIKGVSNVRQGKVFDVDIFTDDSVAAKQNLQAACGEGFPAVLRPFSLGEVVAQDPVWIECTHGCGAPVELDGGIQAFGLEFEIFV